jgi:hypothetical protein
MCRSLCHLRWHCIFWDIPSQHKIYISLFQTSSRKIGDCWEEKSQNIKYIFLCFRQAQGRLEIVGRGCLKIYSANEDDTGLFGDKKIFNWFWNSKIVDRCLHISNAKQILWKLFYSLAPIFAVSTKCIDPQVLDFVFSNTTGNSKWENCISLYLFRIRYVQTSVNYFTVPKSVKDFFVTK